MTRRFVLVHIMVLLVGSLLQAQGKWEVLGQRNVSDRADHDTIAVTRAKGTFKSIRFEVRRHAVDFERVVVHFANGDDQKIELRATIPAGGESRVVDLEGKARVIRTIDLWYDAHTLGRGGSATVRVVGRE